MSETKTILRDKESYKDLTISLPDMIMANQ